MGFDLDIAVEGDIIIGLWEGDHKGQWKAPLLAYAFHTSFTDAGVLRVTPADLDFPLAVISAGAGAEGFFMDIMIREEPAPASGIPITWVLLAVSIACDGSQTTVLHVCRLRYVKVMLSLYGTNMQLHAHCRQQHSGVSDISQLRTEWLSLVVQNPQLQHAPSQDWHHARVLEEMQPFLPPAAPETAVRAAVPIVAERRGAGRSSGCCICKDTSPRAPSASAFAPKEGSTSQTTTAQAWRSTKACTGHTDSGSRWPLRRRSCK